MPELPEVETVTRSLAPKLIGQRVEGLELRDPLLEVERRSAVIGRTVSAVGRVAKQVVLELTADHEPTCWLAFHLRMSGRLMWAEAPDDLGDKHLRARLRFDRSELRFYDVRRLGRIRLVWDRGELSPGGLEPLSEAFTSTALAARLVASRQAIKVWLLRQDGVAGVGNIYASEALYRAGISPFLPARQLDAEQVRRLHEAVVEVLREAVEAGGTTLTDFTDSWGNRGAFQRRLQVYGRESSRCERCEAVIIRVVQQGRSTFYCSRCQGGEHAGG